MTKTVSEPAVAAAMLISLLFMSLAPAAFSVGDEEDMLFEYPDGSYGLNMGEGLDTLSSGDMLPPSGYRDPYADSDYGPMTERGLVVFPSWSFPEYRAGSAAETKEQAEEMKAKEQIIFETTTGVNSSVWGLSD